MCLQLNFVIFLFSSAVIAYVASSVFEMFGQQNIQVDGDDADLSPIDADLSQIESASQFRDAAYRDSFQESQECYSFRETIFHHQMMTADELDSELDSAHADYDEYIAALMAHPKLGEEVDPKRKIALVLIESKLQAIVAQWELAPGSEELRQRLTTKALKVLEQGNREMDTFVSLSIEAMFGEVSWQRELYRYANRATTKNLLHLSYAVFILGAFMQDDVGRIIFDTVFLVLGTSSLFTRCSLTWVARSLSLWIPRSCAI